MTSKVLRHLVILSLIAILIKTVNPDDKDKAPAPEKRAAAGDSSAPSSGATGSRSSGAKLTNKFFYDYRVVNWCLTGRDEPELHEWPFNQFVPFIKRNRRYKTVDPDNNRYRLEIKEVYSRMPWLGATANCHGLDSIPTEGPKFLPAWTTAPVPHIKGPWCEPVQECLYTPGSKVFQGWNPSSYECENVFTEKWTTVSTTTPAPSLPTTTPPDLDGTTTPWPLEFGPLNSTHPRAPKCDETDVSGCRPEVKNSSAFKTLGRLFKTVHITVYAEERRKRSHGIYEKWIPQKIEGILLQANHNPFGVGLPTGEFFTGEFNCLDCGGEHFAEIIPCRKRPSVEVKHPTVATFHHMMKVPKLFPNAPTTGSGEAQFYTEIVGKKSEFHVHFRWHSPPCTQTTRMEFTLMVVRSFKNSDFDVYQMGPYEVTIRGQSYVSDITPTPIYPAFFYDKRLQGTFCHSADSPDFQFVYPQTFTNFEMSHTFDECVRNEANPIKPEIGENLVLEQNSYMCDAPSHPRCFPVSQFAEDRRHFDWEEHFSDAETINCPMPCPDDPTTTPIPVTPKPNKLFKREHHGGMLIMTNFCLMPVSSFIARFYKETFNISRVKGVKAWFWAHIMASAISSILIYFATYHANKDLNKNAHVVLGKTYILILATAYFSAWGRHKTTWINQTAEFLHGVLGYLTFLFAHITMHTAPGVGWVPKLLVDTQMGIHVIFIMILTIHVCLLDKKFGMRPSRRHLPTVEARFDDIPLPKYNFRLAALIILTLITFTLSSISLFLE